MPATLKNVSNQPVTVILDHPALLTPDNGWQRTTAKFGTTDEGGQRHVKEVRRSLPGALTLMPGQEISDLHPAIAKCSQVPNLIAARVLTLTVAPEKKAEKSAEKTGATREQEKKA